MGGKKGSSYHITFSKRRFTKIEKKSKLPQYIVRKDDYSGLGHYLGIIKWHGGWWQYVFKPDSDTIWSYDCLERIVKFLIKINLKQRKKWRKKRVKK